MPKTVKSTKSKTVKSQAVSKISSTNRVYELTFIVSPTVKSENRKKVVDTVKKEITTLKGSVIKVDEWGLKDLAYPIAKQLSGWYALAEISLPAQSAEKLEKLLLQDERILRHLLIRK